MYLQTLFSFGLPSFAAQLLTAIFGIGFGIAIWSWRRPLALLLLASRSAKCLSAPFVIDSGGHRVLAATVGARLTVAVLCIAVAADYLTGRRLVKMTAFHQPRAALIGMGRLIACTGLLLVCLVLVPFHLLGIRLKRLLYRDQALVLIESVRSW